MPRTLSPNFKVSAAAASAARQHTPDSRVADLNSSWISPHCSARAQRYTSREVKPRIVETWVFNWLWSAVSVMFTLPLQSIYYVIASLFDCLCGGQGREEGGDWSGQYLLQ